jgi:hypothetical protein
MIHIAGVTKSIRIIGIYTHQDTLLIVYILIPFIA